MQIRSCFLLAIVALLGAPATSQSVVYEVDHYGSDLAVIGDWNGDLIPEFATSSTAVSPEVRVHSGSDGSLLLSFPSPPAGTAEWYGRKVLNPGDLDGDGVDDLAIHDCTSQSLGGYVELRSSNGGQLLLTLSNPAAGGNYGYTAAPAGDLDLDGVPDLLVANPYKHPGGMAEVRSGANGATLQSWSGADFGDSSFGTAAVALGDVDGDGSEDYAISHATQPLEFGPGIVRVLSGATGAQLYSVGEPFESNEGYGAALLRLSDLDGDAVADFMVTDDGRNETVAFFEFRSGSTGALLNQVTSDTIPSLQGCELGLWAAEVTGSIAGTTLPVVALGAPGCSLPSYRGGIATVIEPISGTFVAELRGEAERGLGLGFAPLADVTGDGRPELLVISQRYGQPTREASLFDLGCGLVQRVCESSNNSKGPFSYGLLFSELSTSVSANEFQLSASGVAGLGPGLYLASPNPNHLPFGDGILCVSSPIQRLLPAAGGAGLGAPVRVDLTGGIPGWGPVVPGSSWYFQLWYRDTTPAGFNLTDSLLVSFCP